MIDSLTDVTFGLLLFPLYFVHLLHFLLCVVRLRNKVIIFVFSDCAVLTLDAIRSINTGCNIVYDDVCSVFDTSSSGIQSTSFKL